MRSEGWLVGRFVGLSASFLSNRGCCRYQAWICGYVQRALGTARAWSGVVQEQPVYGGGLSKKCKNSGQFFTKNWPELGHPLSKRSLGNAPFLRALFFLAEKVTVWVRVNHLANSRVHSPTVSAKRKIDTSLLNLSA